MRRSSTLKSYRFCQDEIILPGLERRWISSEEKVPTPLHFPKLHSQRARSITSLTTAGTLQSSIILSGSNDKQTILVQQDYQAETPKQKPIPLPRIEAGPRPRKKVVPARKVQSHKFLDSFSSAVLSFETTDTKLGQNAGKSSSENLWRKLSAFKISTNIDRVYSNLQDRPSGSRKSSIPTTRYRLLRSSC